MASRSDDPAPYYETHVFVCVNERPPGHKRGCCREKGSGKLRDYMNVMAMKRPVAGNGIEFDIAHLTYADNLGNLPPPL